MPTVTESIQLFISARKTTSNRDLVDRWTPNMETQVNVSAGKGEAGAKRGTYTDGVREWWNIRLPKQADSEPTWTDYSLSWPISEHAEAVGCTGWDYKERRSLWCGFDFDSLVSHAAGVGITDEQLEAVKQAALAVPWIEVRKSTGGAGLHLYVYFEDGIATANHTEHAALARAVLSLLSSEANFDFASQIDACGGIMWIWHRKMTVLNEGLALLKPAVCELKGSEIPSNWRDHAEVVTRKRKKVRIDQVTDETDFESLATSRKFTPLCVKHKAVIAKLGELGYDTIWVSDYHLLQTHTLGLAAIAKDADLRSELDIVGFFETSSSGSTPINCFLFPLPEGGWKVVRFGSHVKESPTWTHDTHTWCYFNRAPDLRLAASALGGTELENNRGYKFGTASAAMQAATALGETIQLPPTFLLRGATLRANKDGRLVMDVAHVDGDFEPGRGWFKPERKSVWTKVCGVQTSEVREDLDTTDSILRVVVTPGGQNAGTYVCSAVNTWDSHNAGMVKMYLQGLGYAKDISEDMIGKSIRRRWEKVSLPFQSEYPGSRRWNLGAPQLRYRPAESRDNLEHGHWDLLLNHVGQSLTPHLRELQWARDANVLTGADYLRCWFASILREPHEPLPYLYLHGPEKSGKTSLWEAFSLLVTSGVVKAHRVLTGISEFNAELLGAILCVVEEISVAKTLGADARIKDYVTATMLSIRKMRADTFSVPNTTHWMQTSNNLDDIKILRGNTRITAFYVPPFAGAQIPKGILFGRLQDEAPAFLRTLLDLAMPVPMDRLRIPMVETETNRHIETVNRNPVEEFCEDCCFEVPGALTLCSEWYARFEKSIAEELRKYWGKQKALAAIPPQFFKAAHSGNQKYIFNLKFDSEPEVDGRRWVLSEGKPTRS